MFLKNKRIRILLKSLGSAYVTIVFNVQSLDESLLDRYRGEIGF